MLLSRTAVVQVHPVDCDTCVATCK